MMAQNWLQTDAQTFFIFKPGVSKEGCCSLFMKAGVKGSVFPEGAMTLFLPDTKQPAQKKTLIRSGDRTSEDEMP